MINQIIIFYCIIFFSFLQSNPNRCVEGIADNRDRPELDTFYLSSSGHFKIHYDIDNDDCLVQVSDLTDLTTEEYNDLGTLLYDNFNYELEGKFI